MTSDQRPKHISVEITDSIAVRDGMRLKVKSLSRGLALTQHHEPSFFHDTGDWHDVTRIFDHEHDRYLEHIMDSEGNLVRSRDVKLSEHRGHGSDRSQPKAHP